MSVSTEKADLSGLRIDHHERDSGDGGSSTKYFIIAGAAVIVLALGYVLLSGSLGAATEVEMTAATLTYPSSANAVLTASGYVVAQQKAAIASKATGRLVFLGVEEGDKVVRNQIIARIEDNDVTAVLQQARANLELAKADLEDANQWVERTRTMFVSGTVSQAELDAAEARFKRVHASIKSAQASVQANEVAFENTRIRSPFDGTVLTKNANVGEMVAPFAAAASSRAAVVTIADMSSLEVEADVSESNITRVTVGGPCEIVLDAYPDVRYQGFVHKIVPTADRAKATVLTKVRFRNRDEKVLPEMSAKVTFLSKEVSSSESAQAPKLTVPGSSVVTRDGKTVVLAVRDDRIVELPVRTTGNIGNRIVIEEGIAQGDRVVLRPDPTLTDGSRVKAKQ